MTKTTKSNLLMQTNEQGRIRSGLMDIYNSMYNHFGSRGWWPGDTKFEICVGAILTQSVAWKNVAKAIDNLKAAELLDLKSMYNASVEEIEACIIPTLYYRMKASKLKAFVNHVTEKYDGDLNQMFSKSLPELRKELLGIYGIGPETADCIILYAAEKPIFVVDAYTKRIFNRLGYFAGNISYDEMQEFFTNHLISDVELFNEYHALIVGVGNKYCSNKKPRCSQCPIMKICRYNT